MAAAAGTRLLAVPDDALGRLEAMGYRSSVLRKQRYPSLDADVITVDFSGFLVFTRSDTPIPPPLHPAARSVWKRHGLVH